MPPSVRFPEVVAAVRNAERCLWRIGDALVKECGPPGERGVNTGALDKLEQCARELRRLGFENYSLDHLRELRRTAAKFADGDRSPSITWSVHAEAGDPGTLKAAIEAATRESSPLTVTFVENFLKRQRQEGHAEYPQSATTLAKRDFDRALANLLDLGVPATEFVEIMYSRCNRAQRWPDFLAAFEEYVLQEAA